MKKENITVLLTGGLGNQLFQLAYGLYLAENSDEGLLIEWKIGKPRLNQSDLPEITSLHLPTNVRIAKKKHGSWLVSKSMGYILRMGVKPRWYERPHFVKALLSKTASTLSFMYFGTKRTIHSGQGIGFSEPKLHEGKQAVIGYFQSYVWASTPRVLVQLMSMNPKYQSEYFISMKSQSYKDRPLIVHVRRGDYEDEESFGILTDTYYSTSITKLMQSKNYNRIWLFSDNPPKAIQVVPKQYLSQVEVISSDLSTAETCELMRFGHAYVIANSTFSWWGAFLSYTFQPFVIAPTPWFKGIDEPIKLIPENWIRVPGHIN